MCIRDSLGGKGKILEITGLEGSTPAMERHRGLADALKAEPGIEIAASVDGAWLQSVAGEKMDSILQDNKDINLVFAQNDRMAVGAYLSARQRQLEKEMLFVGIDALPGKGYGVEQDVYKRQRQSGRPLCRLSYRGSCSRWYEDSSPLFQLQLAEHGFHGCRHL